ncbi:hypothetical protein MASR1M8_15740 [Thermomonas brevis]
MLRRVMMAGGGGSGATDPYWANVVSLLHFDGADGGTTFVDDTGRVWTPMGNAQVDTAQSKFGGASGLFDGSGDAIATPNVAALNFGTGDFTIELWMRTTTTSGVALVAGKHEASTGSWILLRNGASLQLYVSSTGSSWNMVNGIAIGTIAANTWAHIAVVRDGTTFRTFLNGVAGVTSTSSASVFAGAQRVVVGGNIGGAGGDWFSGHIDELRITKGVARYTSNFTPPSAPFPDS